MALLYLRLCCCCPFTSLALSPHVYCSPQGPSDNREEWKWPARTAQLGKGDSFITIYCMCFFFYGYKAFILNSDFQSFLINIDFFFLFFAGCTFLYLRHVCVCWHQARLEVHRFGITGFKKEQQRAFEQDRAIMLGAKVRKMNIFLTDYFIAERAHSS